MRRGRTWGRLAPLLGAIPMVWFATYAPPAGVPKAEACGGSSMGDGQITWGDPFLVGEYEVDEPRPIGSDGFFVVKVTGAGVTRAEAVRELEVTVTDTNGEAVSGTLAALDDPYDVSLFGWSADDELAEGTELDVKLSIKADASVGGDARLRVAGPPTPLSAGELIFDAWIDWRHGVGEPVECLTRTCGGGPLTVTVPADEERRDAVRVSWQPPELLGFVHWQAQVESPEPFDGGVFSYVARTFGQASSSIYDLGFATFRDRAPEQCARLVVTDVRSGERVERELCGEPRPASTVTDDDLHGCESPPNAARTDAWCRMHPDSELAACRSPAVPDELPDASGQLDPVPDDAAASSGERGSRGCQLAGPMTGHSLAPLAVFALGLLRRRRRR